MQNIIGHQNNEFVMGFAYLWGSIVVFYVLYLIANICVNVFLHFKSRPRETFIVHGIHGDITAFTDTGEVVMVNSMCVCRDCQKTGGYLLIVKLDVDEYSKEHPDHILIDNEIWLVNIGYWDSRGNYEPAILTMKLRDNSNE